MSHCDILASVTLLQKSVHGKGVEVMQSVMNTEMFDGKNLIVFDGECVLCSSFFQFMLKRDQSRRFQFATAQSPLGQGLFRQLGLPTQDFETNLVVVDGRVYERLDAFAAAMGQLPGVWPMLSLCRFLPAMLKDPFYGFIARNRYAIWGRSQVCFVPDEDLRSRFAPLGFQSE
ncbi:thiol-disulfide oxidoreductase DCC family protein [Ruegeria sp. EL01]|jgi:predicted DCC family thiol-disulfide oxidoreductase YuxK|uniref:thiol-disulfide oxidoreductase DCC family protein n=1 Tax=Ruegeria sp. EL01 TaxID=2107578 RepID=UPI00352CAB0A